MRGTPPPDAEGVRSTLVESDALRRLEATARASEDRHRAIAELIADFAYAARVEPDGSLVGEWASGHFAGYTADELARIGPLTPVHPDDAADVRDALDRLLQGERVSVLARVITKSGDVKWTRATCMPVWDEAEGRVVRLVGANRDVTDAVVSRRELERSEFGLGVLLRQLPAILWTTDLELTVTSCMGLGMARAGLTPEQVVGTKLTAVWPPGGWQPLDGDETSIALAHERAIAGGASSFDVSWQQRTWQVHVESLRNFQGATVGVVGVSFDVTDARENQRVLESILASLVDVDRERRRLLVRVVEAHEEERRRIAGELHDDLGQRLTSAALYARSVETQATPGTPQAEALGVLRRELERSLAIARSLVWSLRPTDIAALGLLASVERLADEIETRHGLRVDIHSNGMQERLPADVETAAYRIMQEALTNAVKHSRAESVSVHLRRARSLRAIVEDDGKGFDTAVGSALGVGLLSMRERARDVGGELVIESSPGTGTTIRLDIPLDT